MTKKTYWDGREGMSANGIYRIFFSCYDVGETALLMKQLSI